MTIHEALQHPGVRISCGNRWLVLEGDTYAVFEHKYGSRTSVIIADTANEEKAVDALLNESEGEA